MSGPENRMANPLCELGVQTARGTAKTSSNLKLLNKVNDKVVFEKNLMN